MLDLDREGAVIGDALSASVEPGEYAFDTRRYPERCPTAPCSGPGYARPLNVITLARPMERDPLHPIVERPWQHAISALHFHAGLDGGEPYLDMDLERDGVVRRLRFWSPQQLEIEGGFPRPTHGMVILDVRRRQLDGLEVWVTDFEASSGKISFWAREVVDRDKL